VKESICDHNMGKVQSNTTCNVYIAKRFFTWLVSTTTCFGLYIGHHQVEHFILNGNLLDVNEISLTQTKTFYIV